MRHYENYFQALETQQCHSCGTQISAHFDEYQMINWRCTACGAVGIGYGSPKEFYESL
jgi:DNA-directed RNA polymerase subunit N (RpoN/RPB10)